MKKPAISFEFFPPRSPVQERRFWSCFGALQTLNPEYVSMTWGALGTSSQASVDVLEGLTADSKVPLAAHLTCIGHTEKSIRQTIAMLDGLGIKRYVALRGDQPERQTDPELLQHASDLVAILAEDPARDISVAAYPEAHPESDDSRQDLRWLKHKLDQGAQRAITQFFFEADTFLRFRDRAVAAGITQSLVPGILPIHDIAKVQEFSGKCGAHVPDALVQRFGKAQGCIVRRRRARWNTALSLLIACTAKAWSTFICTRLTSQRCRIASARRWTVVPERQRCMRPRNCLFPGTVNHRRSKL